MRYFECLSANRFRNHTGILTVVRAALVLCSASMLRSDKQASSDDGNTPSPSQTQGRNSGARRRACQSEEEPEKARSQGSCIVDLKPGDVRLFEPSGPATGRLHRW